jgi:hypothetical protein
MLESTQYPESAFENYPLIGQLLAGNSDPYAYDELLIGEVKSPADCAAFWMKHLLLLCYTDENTYGRRDDVEKKISADIACYFSQALLAKVLTYYEHWLDSSLQDCLYCTYPLLSFIEASRLSAWQWYSASTSKTTNLAFFQALSEAPAPFDDPRFSMIPVHCSMSNNMGYNSSITYYHQIMRNIYLDAKMALLFHFKGKASMLVGFNIDANKNIYVHQLQALAKDRGHYKLGAQWRECLLTYLQKVFPTYTVHLLKGTDMAKLVLEGFRYAPDDSPSRPHDAVLSRIKSRTDSLYQQSSAPFNYKGYDYRTVSACLLT